MDQVEAVYLLPVVVWNEKTNSDPRFAVFMPSSIGATLINLGPRGIGIIFMACDEHGTSESGGTAPTYFMAAEHDRLLSRAGRYTEALNRQEGEGRVPANKRAYYENQAAAWRAQAAAYAETEGFQESRDCQDLRVWYMTTATRVEVPI